MKIGEIFICPICKDETSLAYKGKDLFDEFGNKINFRRSCSYCGYTPRLTHKEIGIIIASAKAEGVQC
jgi:Zn ribbon nucleic-acid-binding protein